MRQTGTHRSKRTMSVALTYRSKPYLSKFTVHPLLRFCSKQCLVTGRILIFSLVQVIILWMNCWVPGVLITFRVQTSARNDSIKSVSMRFASFHWEWRSFLSAVPIQRPHLRATVSPQGCPYRRRESCFSIAEIFLFWSKINYFLVGLWL